ncbi:hypothetical protein O1D97_13765 [Marinomonas sp. 15G1-11]|uniref:Uncharacterized protein n=1 Tax=Marinomonas phaeophyticola TaxID=3004091 RepID=A0ABT4JW87_9GAMM|nr:hypothetical protein [Marinomonas sp. 15G1-11]MCZ2722646.1 hypothetical protein [Marinomonas sp. 15G1-11]
MFRRKKHEDSVSSDTKEFIEPQEQVIHDSPQICLFDFEDDITETLKGASYSCSEGTLGKLVRVPNNQRNQQHFLSLNSSSPVNIHEYDILAFNMSYFEEADYEDNQVSLDNVTGKATYALLSAFPEKVFNPRPYATSILSKDINEILKKESIIIIFADKNESVHYQEVEIGSYENRITKQHELTNTCFYDGFPYCYNKSGLKMKAPEKETKLTPLLLKYSKDAAYEIAFHHPTHWDNRKQEKDNNFIPLLVNNDDEIISFYHAHSKGAVLVFPDIKDKKGFLLELFNNHLSEMFPNIFPFHGQFGWLDNGDYLLPGEAKLIEERTEIEKQYSKAVLNNENAILELKDEFKFLRDLISESGDNLVSAVEHYLKWLGFPSVINFDDTNPEILEEDIQVDCGDRFLVVEIKGIGGTSTDKDCSQISKIRYRRAEQRGKFDVFGLYIVNHQRYTPPESRCNPPFTENQINDARLDKRGLITTYSLYKAYEQIENGVLTKEEVRENLFEHGLIEPKPTNLISLGKPAEFFMSGQVAIVNLQETKLTKGMDVFINKNGVFNKIQISSLKVDDKNVDEISDGEVGIKFNGVVKKNSELLIKEV